MSNAWIPASLITLTILALIIIYLATLPPQTEIIVTPTDPNIKLGVYSNPAATKPLFAIDWGAMQPGETATQTFYIKNKGSVDCMLSWGYSDEPSFIILQCSELGTVAVNDVYAVTLTETIMRNVTASSYSYTIHLRAEES